MAEIPLEDGLNVLEGRCRIATYTIYAFMVLCAAMMLVTIGMAGGQVNFDDNVELDTLSAIGSLASVAYLIVFIASIIVVAMWIYRARANLRAAGIDGLEYTPGWSVGWFFVPIANLFKPFDAMRELWNVSHVHSDSDTRNTPSTLIAWWACYIVGSMLSRIGTRIPEEIGYLLEGISSLVLIGSAWFLLQIVKSITRAQNDLLAAGHTFA